MLKRLLLAALIWLAPAAHAAPTEEMFAKLKAATEEAEAADVAADIWATWMESGSATVDLLMQRTLEALGAEDTGTAHELLDRVILLKPDYPEAYHRRAGLFLMEENYPEAFRDLNEALKLEPRHFGAWLGMAWFRHKTQKQRFRRYAWAWTLLNPFWALVWWTVASAQASA